MAKKTPVSPVAARIIAKLGGHQAVADLLGIDVSRVYRFTYERERGGTGGLIPAKYHEKLLTEGQEKGVTPRDFFERARAVA